MRLFVAIDLHHAWRAALSRLLTHAPASPGVRWVRTESLHITLWFLGDADEARLPELNAAVSDAGARAAPFELRMGTLGCFPSRGRPRVLWVGAEDAAGGCQRWIDAARGPLTRLSFVADERPFQPHITLARADEGRSGEVLQSLSGRLQVPAVLPMQVGEVTVFSSRLTPRGAVYEPLLRAPLGLNGDETAAPDREG